MLKKIMSLIKMTIYSLYTVIEMSSCVNVVSGQSVYQTEPEKHSQLSVMTSYHIIYFILSCCQVSFVSDGLYLRLEIENVLFAVSGRSSRTCWSDVV